MPTVASAVYYATLPTPLGELVLTSDGECLTGVSHTPSVGRDWLRDPAALAPAVEQLRAYFGGELRAFDLPLRLTGTPFQQTVWAELRRIPYGETISYAELARRVGDPKAARAVGSANGRNPVGVVVPCHRVIAADGTLGGYGWGLDRKRWLLDHEANHR